MASVGGPGEGRGAILAPRGMNARTVGNASHYDPFFARLFNGSAVSVVRQAGRVLAAF